MLIVAPFMQIEFGPRAIALVGVSALVFACGGRTTATTDGGTGASGSMQGASPNGATSADESWDGGLIGPTPGSVRCGNVDCNAKTDACCLQESGNPATNGCASRDDALCNGTQVRRTCDEAADCNPGEVCCMEVVTSPPATIGSYCFRPDGSGAPGTCPTSEIVACSSDADCIAANAPPCVAQTCRGNVLQTCGLLPSEWCDP